MARKSTAAADKPRRSPPAAPEAQMTCFVVIGFGRKTDFATGRVLDLDKTYEQLIRPAFDEVEVNCFRAIDANLTGSIDSIMYQWLYEADFVIADLSTLNANVFYELGVRHAQKPNTTLIIAESVLMTKIPFDLSSFVIHQYEHAGDKIAPPEQKRFVRHLSAVLKDIIAVDERRRAREAAAERQNDSPVFTFLSGMTPPQYDFETFLAPPLWVRPKDRAKAPVDAGQSLAGLIHAAEAAKKTNDFATAIELFSTAIAQSKDKDKPDIFLAQRLALVTYKAGEPQDENDVVDKDAAVNALFKAEEILGKYCAPKISTDPETLGLSGAINKRLYDWTGDPEYLERAIRFYERGFYVKQDYYNGINVAFMYTMKANLVRSRFDAIVAYGHGNLIRTKVAEICDEIINDEAGFGTLADSEKQWVYMTLAETYQGRGMRQEEERLARKIEKVATDFGRRSYLSQKKKLQAAIDEFDGRIHPEALEEPLHDSELEAGPQKVVRPARAATVTRATPDPATFSQRAITIDANIVKHKPIKSVEVSCKIEYE